MAHILHDHPPIITLNRFFLWKTRLVMSLMAHPVKSSGVLKRILSQSAGEVEYGARLDINARQTR